MLLEEFKNIVDNHQATINIENYLNIGEQLGIDFSLGYSRDKITAKFYENIKESLTINRLIETENILKTRLLKLQSELVYRYILFEENPIEYLMVLNVIQDSCRNDIDYLPPFSDNEKWGKAIINCKNYNKFSPDTHSISIDRIRTNYPKYYDIACSIKKLIEKGCEVEIKDSEIHIVNGLENIVRELDEKIKKCGGLFLMKVLFHFLKQNEIYSKRFERYFITRQTSYKQKPQTPFGYLLNLSLKYPYEKTIIGNQQEFLNEILELSVLITNGVYGVQQYNCWVYFFQTGETIMQFCTEIALWDSIFSLPQCRPSTAIEIVDKLFSFIDDTFFCNRDYTS